MNYKNWFFNQYKYLSGKRGNKESFNDTKWIDMFKRYRYLEEESELITQQPYGVMGNEYGFDKLIELMSLSNYSFEDINKAMIDTYHMSLLNAMGDMTVNTQTVLFQTKNTEVKSDRSGKYYVIDAPFNQMHFGERDEFIRQRLHQIHTTENQYYVDINDFMSTYISEILGFSILCTVNGYICNDCKIAIDDKGFKFKVRWGYSSDVDFILYKLDHSFVYKVNVDSYTITSAQNIQSEVFDELFEKHGKGQYKCLVNIYDENFASSVPTVPNFGLLTSSGLRIINLQNKTIDMINRNKSSTVNVVVYALKYFHEVPNLYPAINYYDLMDSRKVYTDKHDNVDDVNGNRIVSTSTDVINHLEICTPPISLDRSSTKSFSVIVACMSMESNLNALNEDFLLIGGTLNSDMSVMTVQNNIINRLNRIIPILKTYYIQYEQGSIITSLVPMKYVKSFGNLIDKLQSTLDTAIEEISKEEPDFIQISKYNVDEFYGDNYKSFVNKISSPFKNEKFSSIYEMRYITPNYFTNDNSTRFNRPVSEYCFITLKYNHSEGCWLFDNPTIKHFHGISNTFYIDSHVNGDEIYKFFVLYTDTKNSSETNVDVLTQDQIFDFDMFVNEVERHIGYIRYWYAENKLMKLCNIIYNKYNQDICIQILSKILKRKIQSNDILHEYPSMIEYELSAINSFNVDGDIDDEQSPFALNYMFYTLNMLNGNEDKLQSYFVHRLVDNKFNPRYVDVNISSLISTLTTYPINLSQFIYAQRIDPTLSNIPDKGYNTFVGNPFIYNESGVMVNISSYPYMYNICYPSIQYPLVSSNIDDEYYAMYNTNSYDYGYIGYTYNNDIKMASLCCKYLTSLYSYISEFQTNYTKSFNMKMICDRCIETLTTHINEIQKMYDEDSHFMLLESYNIGRLITVNNSFVSLMESLKTKYDTCVYVQSNVSIFGVINDLLRDLKNVFHLFGFNNYALKSIRALYIHLKKINQPMDMYTFKRWLSGINYQLIEMLGNMLSNNENIDISPSIFYRYATLIRRYIVRSFTVFDSITQDIESMTSTMYESDIQPIVDFCDDIVNNYIFDLYTIKDVTFDTTVTATNPHLVVINVDGTDNHFKIPVRDSVASSMNMIFTPVCDGTTVVGVNSLCVYTVFDGTPITNAYVEIWDENGNVLTNTTATITFTKVGTTADINDNVSILPDVINTPLDFQNIHESYDIDTHGNIISSKRTPISYEMLFSNHFIPLTTVNELILNQDGLPGPIDRLYLSNKVLNQNAIEAYGNHNDPRMFFKPCQVLHITPEKDIITSIGGKYFPGQRLYLYTTDTHHIFPVVVNAIDWSMQHGFVEATVDSYNTQWLQIKDKELISKYLNEPIECEVIDDNISNFLDEFSNGEYYSYDIVENNNITDEYTLPGDPVYVTNNADYVYTRLNYFFNDSIPNRFIDEDHKMFNFVFLGWDNITDEKDTITLNMLNHDYNDLTLPELHPILRHEPNDHEVWDEEKRVFNEYLDMANTRVVEYRTEMAEYYDEMVNAETEEEYEKYLRLYQNASYRASYYDDFSTRVHNMLEQPEPPTTWFNIRSYDATQVYISNGRSKPFSTAYISNVRYGLIVDKSNLFIYDWENKQWLDPSTYTLTTTVVDGIATHNYDRYNTNNVLYKIDITFNEGYTPSKKLLMYLGYDKSDLFDDIVLNPKTCQVKFKPILSTNKKTCNDLYKDNIRIRKTFDGYERYRFEQSDDVFDNVNYHVKRVERNGKYMYSPSLRLCDLIVTQSNTDYTYEHFNVFVKNPFKDTSTGSLKHLVYNATVNQPIDSFVEGKHIKLVCISNNASTKFSGTASNVMFDAITSSEGGTQKITIVDSNLDINDVGSYICSIIHPNTTDTCIGGIITIDVSVTDEEVLNGEWIQIKDNPYMELPDEFVITPNDITLNDRLITYVTLKDSYERDYDDTIDINNTGLYNPYEFYYDLNNKLYLPISNVRYNNSNERFVVDTTLNPDIELIKSTHVRVSRFSLRKIPEDGFIDVTGYIPTPLSRDRYEFYVNGRFVDDLVILSPTSFQLLNLRSLKNFELIELVDDMNDSDVTPKNIVYTSIDGKPYSSYSSMLKSSSPITKQSIRYTFNIEQHHPYQDYTLIENPSNVDMEPDILDMLTYSSDVTSYDELFNIPTINGEQLKNLYLNDLRLTEIPDEDILNAFDKVWKRERVTNPFFPYTHFTENKKLSIRIKDVNLFNIPDPENWICVYVNGITNKYFTMYISNNKTDDIDDVNNTVKIIPCIKTGTFVFIDKSYRGKWIHITLDNCEPIKLT